MTDVNLKQTQEAKKQKDIDRVGFVNIKIKKLKLAKALAITQSAKKRVAGDSDDLLDDVEAKIKSLALSKFAIRKVKRLKALGKQRDEITSIISELAASEDSILDKATKLKIGFGIDKKFIGLTAAEVLDKIGYMPKEDKKKEEKRIEDEVASVVTDDVIKDVTDAIMKEVKVLNRELSDDEMKEVTKAVVSQVMDIAVDEVTSGKSIKQSKEEALKKVKLSNEKIYEYLVKSGDLEAAEFVLDRITAPEDNVKNLSEARNSTKEIQRLSDINSGILEKLTEIEENMIDEQDTSVDLPTRLQKEKERDEAQTTTEKKEDSSWLSKLMTMLFGPVMGLLFKGIKSLGALAVRVLSAGMGWLTNKVKDIFASMFKLAIGPIQKVIDLILGVVSKIPGVGKALSFAGKAVKGVGMGVAGAAAMTGFFTPKASAEIDSKEKLSESKKKTEIEKNKAGIGKDVPKMSKSNIATKLLRFAKPIPLIGTAIAAGTAIYAAVDGYNNADEILGKDKNKLTEMDKLASAAGNLVSDITFGLVSAKSTANALLTWAGENETRTTDADLGIVKKDGQQVTPPSTEQSVTAPSVTAPSDSDVGDPDSLLRFTARTGSEDSFNKIDSGLQDKVLEAASNLDGGKIQINSAYRDPRDQQRLWDESVALGTPGRGPTGMLVGKPGTSLHEKGLAVDVQPTPAVVAAMKDAGLKQPYPDTDPVHFVKAGGNVSAEKKAGGDVAVTGIVPEKTSAAPVQMASKDNTNKKAAVQAAEVSQQRNTVATRAATGTSPQGNQVINNNIAAVGTQKDPSPSISSAFITRTS